MLCVALIVYGVQSFYLYATTTATATTATGSAGSSNDSNSSEGSCSSWHGGRIDRSVNNDVEESARRPIYQLRLRWVVMSRCGVHFPEVVLSFPSFSWSRAKGILGNATVFLQEIRVRISLVVVSFPSFSWSRAKGSLGNATFPVKEVAIWVWVPERSLKLNYPTRRV